VGERAETLEIGPLDGRLLVLVGGDAQQVGRDAAESLEVFTDRLGLSEIVVHLLRGGGELVIEDGGGARGVVEEARGAEPREIRGAQRVSRGGRWGVGVRSALEPVRGGAHQTRMPFSRRRAPAANVGTPSRPCGGQKGLAPRSAAGSPPRSRMDQ